jgi:excisionase family DNA binding protein
MGKLGGVMPDPTFSSHATPRQVAERYAVTVPTVLGWHRAGIIPAKVAIGRIYRFDLAEVDAALARHRSDVAASRQTTNPAHGHENLV